MSLNYYDGVNMKTEISSPRKVYVPVAINITMESQDELDKFYTLFNHKFIKRYFEKSQNNILEVLESGGAHRYHFIEYLDSCFKGDT
jgi:hypothetical protein